MTSATSAASISIAGGDTAVVTAVAGTQQATLQIRRSILSSPFHRFPIHHESGTSRRESIAIAHMFRAIPPSLHIAAAPTGSASTSYPTKVAENAHLFLWTLLLSTKIATSCTSTKKLPRVVHNLMQCTKTFGTSPTNCPI